MSTQWADISTGGTPYAPAFVSALLRNMDAARLSTIRPEDFQRWPAKVIAPAKLLRELISNEKARRR